MRSPFLLVILLALTAYAVFAGKRVFYSTVFIQAATTTVSVAKSYLVILGVVEALLRGARTIVRAALASEREVRPCVYDLR
jgi:hypothetical protein